MPTFHLVFNVPPTGAAPVRDWLATLTGKTAVITSECSEIRRWDLGVPIFTDRELIPGNSPLDTRIRRENRQHRRMLAHRLRKHTFLGVPLINDLERAASQRYEHPKVVARAAEMLIRGGYDRVAVVLDFYLDSYTAVFREACACGFSPTEAFPLRYLDGALRPDPRIARRVPSGPLLDALRTGPTMSDEKCAWLVDRFAGDTGGTIVLLSSTEPAYADPAAEVIRVLRDRSEPLHILALSPSVRETWNQSYDIPSDLLVPDDNRDPLDRDAILAATAAFLTAYQTDVEQRLPSLSGRSTNLLGLRTSDFIDAATSDLDLSQLVFQYAISVERLDMIVRLARPSALYNTSIAHGLDDALVHLCRRYRVRGVSAIVTLGDSEFKNASLRTGVGEYLAVVGEDEIAPLVARGHSAESIVPVGRADLDPVIREWTPDRGRAYLRTIRPELDPARAIAIAITGSTDADCVPVWIEQLGEIARQRDDIDVFVKPHPANDGTTKRTLSAGRTAPTISLDLGQSGDLHAYLSGADVVITDLRDASTLAILYGKPVIAIHFGLDATEDNRFNDEGVMLWATNAVELDRAVHRLLDSAVARAKLALGRPAYIRRHFTSNDGHAAERIIDLLVGTRGLYWGTNDGPPVTSGVQTW